MKKLIYLIIVFILYLGCVKQTVEKKHEDNTNHSSTVKEQASYVHPDGSICHAQSPINILSFNVDSEGMHNITFNFKDEINVVKNLGHTVQLNLKEGSTIIVDNETFDFKQLHFHTPSEHLIDGIVYPLEMHMVHTLKNQKENEQTEYLVIGVLFKMGAESKFINEFINTIPTEEHSKRNVQTGEIRLTDLISEVPESVLEEYYHYKGSLTTPPYTESVRWYVSKKIFKASPKQIKKILEIEGNNARQVQKLNERTLEGH